MKNKLLIFFKTLLISLILISCSENNKLENVNKILLFGDSLMSGYGLKENQALSIILENDLKETGYNIRVINGSVSGDTSGDGLYRIEEYTSGGDVDLIVLGLGANDMLRRINPDQTESNLRKIIEIIKTKNIKIILAGMKASPTNGLAYKKRFDDIFPKLAEEYDLTPTHLAHAFVNSRPFVTSNIIGATTMEQLKENVESINIEFTDEMMERVNEIHNNNPNPSP